MLLDDVDHGLPNRRGNGIQHLWRYPIGVTTSAMDSVGVLTERCSVRRGRRRAG
jgi:hypothetical protein